MKETRTFVLKCATIWLLASSNWDLSSLILWRRALAAAKDILTYMFWDSSDQRIYRNNKATKKEQRLRTILQLWCHFYFYFLGEGGCQLLRYLRTECHKKLHNHTATEVTSLRSRKSSPTTIFTRSHEKTVGGNLLLLNMQPNTLVLHITRICMKYKHHIC